MAKLGDVRVFPPASRFQGGTATIVALRRSTQTHNLMCGLGRCQASARYFIIASAKPASTARTGGGQF